MRQEITEHQVEGIESCRVYPADEPSNGGASHEYVITSPDRQTIATINFQKGPTKEVGFNGVTNAALIAIILDQLRAFQDSSFRSRENAIVITHLEESLMWLQKRQRDRLARGVQGELKP